MGKKLFEILKKNFPKKNFQKKHFFSKKKKNTFFQKNQVLVYWGKNVFFLRKIFFFVKN